MTTNQIHTGYVITDQGSIYLQIPTDNQWGFSICDDDQAWPGGFGVGSKFTAIADDDSRITDEDRERLESILDEARA